MGARVVRCDRRAGHLLQSSDRAAGVPLRGAGDAWSHRVTVTTDVRSLDGAPRPHARAAAAVRSVLVPIDLTAISDRLIARLALLPLADDARITLLHVVPDSLRVRDQHRAERDAHRFLDDEAGYLADALSDHVSVRPMVTHGAPAKAIVARANAMHAELIVMGRGGERALREVFLGSTAERVIRASSAPVLVVRLPARRAYQHPALALELQPAPHDVIAGMLRVVSGPRPRVTVVHTFDAYYGLASLGLSDEELAHRHEELAHGASRELARILAASVERARIAPRDAPSWRYLVEAGSPRINIEKAVRRLGADLLVLGTRGRKGIAHMLLGSVAGDVLREVPCDVLVVPPASASSRH